MANPFVALRSDISHFGHSSPLSRGAPSAARPSLHLTCLSIPETSPVEIFLNLKIIKIHPYGIGILPKKESNENNY